MERRTSSAIDQVGTEACLAHRPHIGFGWTLPTERRNLPSSILTPLLLLALILEQIQPAVQENGIKEGQLRLNAVEYQGFVIIRAPMPGLRDEDHVSPLVIYIGLFKGS